MLRLVPLLVLFLPFVSSAQEFEAGTETAVSALAPVAAGRADLSGQFDPAPRDQGHMSSCHDFVAVALLEAAYFRRYARRVRLSEADLFVRRTAAPALPFLRTREGGMLKTDLRYALTHGVMPGDLYAEFEARWHAFERRTFKFLDGRASVITELLPESATSEADSARAKIKDELAGVEVQGESFFQFAGATVRSAFTKGPVRCGRGRVARLLTRRLDEGLPVGVGLNSGWAKSPEWRRNASGPGGSHYFVVTGYDGTGDELVFHTRNTWRRGGSPDLAADDLCEVFAMTWLR